MRGFQQIECAKVGDMLMWLAVATDGTLWGKYIDERGPIEWEQLPALPQPEVAGPHHELAAEILRKLDAGEITDEQAREHAYSCYGDHGNQLWAELDRRRSADTLAKLRGEA